MKFKKVEIQAFRAYDKVENGTFDFSDQQTGKIADFISIYAPNGFGKTSFYDAVEWGFTNNINRFLRKHGKNADAAKAERTYKADFGSKDKQHIIRNKFSDPNLEGFVRLSTTTNDNVIVNKIPDVRSGQPDFKFRTSDTKKGTEFFQDVLLSQEWIDAFLKEDDSNIRYEKFITYFGDKKLDDYYKTIVGLIKSNETNIADLKSELQKCQLKLNFDGDRDILIKINSHIELLNVENFGFKKIDSDFTDKDFLELSNLIDTRMLDLEFALEKVNENEKAIERLLIGTTDEPGIAEYTDALKKLTGGLNRLKGLQVERIKLEAAKKDQNELSNSAISLESLSELIREANQIKSVFGDYVTQVFRQGEILAESSLLGEKLVQKQNKSQTEQVKLKQAEAGINSIIVEIQKLETEFVNLKGEEETKLNLDNTLLQLNKEQDDISQTLSGKKAELNVLNQDLEELQLAQSYLTELKLQLLSENIQTEFSKPIALAKKLIEKQHKSDADIARIQQAIDQQQILSEEIQQFVLKGAEIVSNTKNSNCPLCNSHFKSFEDLTLAINSNKALTHALQSLVLEKTNRSKDLEEIHKDITDELSSLRKHLEDRNLQVTSEIKIREEAIEGLNTQLNDRVEKIADINEKLVEWSIKLNSLTPEEYNSNKQESINLQKKDLEKLQTSVKNTTGQIARLEKEINTLKNIISDKEEVLRQLRNDSTYLSVVSFFTKQFPGQLISLEILEPYLSELLEKQKAAEAGRSDLVKSVEIFVGQNLTSLIEENNNEIKKSEESNADLLRVINRFEQVAFSLGLNFKRTISLKQLEILLKNELADLNKRTERSKLGIQNLHLLKRFQQNVMPFLNHQKLMKTADELEKRIKVLRDKVGKQLSTERDKISKFIHEQVESFFYEDLINVLYRKVDPHPEYKKIKFQCDFTNDKPKLNVFVTGENGDNPLVPNLYFSTAQMNILSLSIFLAKALNAVDSDGDPVSCIFIDDPIQSMDSINILSTIDLFRSIVVKFKKQIILSTHDENFHNLLRRKIPDSLFNAKYIELETFGTVRPTQFAT